MKIFINNRNYLTWPSIMANQFADQNHEVIFIDNGSTYGPLLDWYSKCSFEIIRLPNLGAQALWISGIANKQKEPFVLSDPDYDLNMIPNDWPEVLLEGLNKFQHVSKVGLSWDESRVPPENPAWIHDKMYQFPNDTSIAWAQGPELGWHNYPCDTSFAIYRPGVPFIIDGLRKGRPYTGIHLPWHITLDPTKNNSKLSIPFNDEIEYYFDHVENSSCTRSRIDNMLLEYKRRKNENRLR